MRLCYKILMVTVISTFCFSGCMYPSELYATGLNNINDPYAQHRDHFGSGEIPAIVVTGYSGQTVNLVVIDLSTAQTVFDKTA